MQRGHRENYFEDSTSSIWVPTYRAFDSAHIFYIRKPFHTTGTRQSRSAPFELLAMQNPTQAMSWHHYDPYTRRLGNHTLHHPLQRHTG